MRDHRLSQPFHEGELAVQERAGERDVARRNSVGISSRIVAGALSFLARQRLLALTVDADDGQLWTSVWCGEPGFVTSEDGQRVSIRLGLLTTSADDPVRRRLAVGREVGVLAIELTSRRRLRINGTIEALLSDEIRIVVHESVSNCPKYIQRRQPFDVSTTEAGKAPTEAGRKVDDRRRELIERADTAFVGSVHPAHGVDASHRGGAPGFIRVVDATRLRVPDYRGNGMFMTLGNFAVDSRASLAVIDFERRRVVSFSGSARLHFETENAQHPTGGTGRYWDFTVREWIEFDLPSAIRWELLDASPYNP
jgi:predicted pyridoxine 5'-phosphate oxidase superfamily flavin-nucleotide-binding protein